MKEESYHDVPSSSRYNNWKYRYLFLFFLSSVRLICNYCLELPSGIEDTIIKVMGVSTAEYGLLFSVSAWPSIILCLIGGILVDRLVGLRLGLFIVVSSVLLGQIIWAIGGFTDKYLIMLVGRFFIGAGNELVIVIGHAFKAVWFKEDLPFALSIDIGFSRVGGTLAILLPQLIYDRFSIFKRSTIRLGVTLLTAAGLMIIALVFTFIVFCMDYVKEKSLQKQSESKSKASLKSTFMKSIKQFSFIFWLGLLVYITYLCVIYSFVSVAQVFFVNKYGLSINIANLANSLLFGSAVIFTPIAGVLVTKTGFHLFWTLGCCFFTALPASLILTFSVGDSYIPFVAGLLYSLSYTLGGPSFTALPALIIDKEYITTAYGILKSSYNASLSVIVYVTGLVIDTLGYFVLQAFFTHLIIVSTIVILIMIFLDAASDNPKLNVLALRINRKRNKDCTDSFQKDKD